MTSTTTAPARRDTLADRWKWLGRTRDTVSKLPGGRLTWRVIVAVLGLAIIAVGILLLPLPGPGWVIIFVGLGVWATEFEWAGRLLTFARRQVKAWTDWVKRQSRPVQALVALGSVVFLAAVALGSWWLLQKI